MAVAKEIALPSLVDYGVSALADLVYRVLAVFGPLSVGDISGSLELPVRQVRLALDELTALGAAAPAVGGAGGHTDDRLWSGRSPAKVLELLHRLRSQSAQDRQRLHAKLARIGYPCALGDPTELHMSGIRSLTGSDRMRRRLAELLSGNLREYLVINPEPAFNAAQVKAAAPANRALMARGIKVRSLGVPADEHDESGWHDAELRANGMEYRQLPQVTSKLYLLDRATALVPLDPGRLRRGFWEITDPGVVARLVDFFYQQWDHAIEPQRSWIPPMTLSPRETAIVALLADGYTDASIADKLDLSVRTIAYAVSGLMERYHVTNRFQLGLKLGAQAEREQHAGQNDVAGSEPA